MFGTTAVRSESGIDIQLFGTQLFKVVDLRASYYHMPEKVFLEPHDHEFKKYLLNCDLCLH